MKRLPLRMSGNPFFVNYFLASAKNSCWLNPEELISSYLSVLSGLMVLNAQGIGGYRLPEVDMLLRLIARP